MARVVQKNSREKRTADGRVRFHLDALCGRVPRVRLARRPGGRRDVRTPTTDDADDARKSSVGHATSSPTHDPRSTTRGPRPKPFLKIARLARARSGASCPRLGPRDVPLSYVWHFFFSFFFFLEILFLNSCYFFFFRRRRSRVSTSSAPTHAARPAPPASGPTARSRARRARPPRSAPSGGP